jgi:hypothetical protein
MAEVRRMTAADVVLACSLVSMVISSAKPWRWSRAS